MLVINCYPLRGRQAKNVNNVEQFANALLWRGIDVQETGCWSFGYARTEKKKHFELNLRAGLFQFFTGELDSEKRIPSSPNSSRIYVLPMICSDVLLLSYRAR